MKNKVLEIISFVTLIVLLMITFISSIKITYLKLDLFNYSILVIIIGIISLITYIMSKYKNFKFNKYEIIIFILMILSCLSLFSAKNVRLALSGETNRNEGLYVILSYYLFFLNGMNIHKKGFIKTIITAIVIIGFINVVYGLMQTQLITIRFVSVRNYWYYARGLFGNSMFYGTFMTIVYPLILGLFIKERKITKKILLLLLIIVFSLGVVISGSMGCFLSIFLIYGLLLIGIIVLFIKKKKEWINLIISTVTSILIMLASIFLITSYNTFLKQDIMEFFEQTSNINKIEDDYGTGRIYIWKNTLKKIKENPFGVGIDNFSLAFTTPLVDKKSNGYVDKAHNDYLQKMLCEGVIAGLIFIVLLLIIFFKNIFRLKDNYYFPLFLAFTAYSIQAFFGISITRIAPIYFIIMGLLVNNEKSEENG